MTSLAQTNGAPPDATNESESGTKTLIKQIVVIKPNKLPAQKNKATYCKPVLVDAALQTKPDVVDACIQTDIFKEESKVIPIPVPIYVPAPMWMYSMPCPTPFPFPLPVPVPIFVPTTRKSANGIMKEIKKIQVKIPTDPYEAELLMMAEMVAADKKEENTDSDTDEEDNTAPPPDDSYSPEPDSNNAFGEDMLQIALKMASEMEEPAVDLEGALTASTITASTQANDSEGKCKEFTN